MPLATEFSVNTIAGHLFRLMETEKSTYSFRGLAITRILVVHVLVIKGIWLKDENKPGMTTLTR